MAKQNSPGALRTLLHPFAWKDKHLLSAPYNLRFPLFLLAAFLTHQSQGQESVCCNSPLFKVFLWGYTALCALLSTLGNVCHETRILLALRRQGSLKKVQIPQPPDQIW